MTEDQTVQISALPRPASTMWLGVAAGAAGLSWLVTLGALFAVDPEPELLIIVGLGISVTVSVGTVAAWTRQNLATAAAEQQQQLQHIGAGQYALAMAELHGIRQLIEEAAGLATAQRQALSAKIDKVERKVEKVERKVEDYWHGVADTVEQMVGDDGSVVPMIRGRARVPQHR